MKIKKNDIVLITKGKYRGKTGKVLQILSKKDRIIVEGVNISKKRVKPKKSDDKGKTIEIPSPFPVANAKLICPKCKKATRVGYMIKPATKPSEKPQKVRICKKCKKEIA